MSKNLVLFATQGGTEIIAEIDPSAPAGEKWMYVKHPLAVRPIQQEAGRFALDLFPYSLTNPDGGHKFNKDLILSTSDEIPEMLSKAYLERTTSILLASAVDAMERSAK